MNLFLVVLILLLNLVFAQPSFADQPKFSKNSDYIEITKDLSNLRHAKDTHTQYKVDNYTAEETQNNQNKIDELNFLKYTLETGIDWGQCRNETGKTLAVYGPKPKNFDDDEYLYDNGLYFLADGYSTKSEWDCDGIYLPSDVKTAGISSDGQGQEMGGPVAIKIADGTQLVVQTTPNTPSVEFNTPLTEVLKSGEANWFIPTVPQAVIDTRVANAPAVKIAERNQLVSQRHPERDTIESNTPPKVESNTPPKTKPQKQVKPQPQPQSQQNFLRTGYFRNF